MPTKHEVAPGDCISSIAETYGFFPDTLWKHADNAALKEKRKDPNVLFPGDVVAIPDKTAKVASKAAGQRHRFKRKGVPEKLRLQLKRDNKPRANLPYQLDIDGALTKGKTDAKGWLEHWIPPGARKAVLILADDETYEIGLGELAPITELAGIQGRLRNLGLFFHEVDGISSPALEEALRRFQLLHDLKSTGEVDAATTKALKQAHGS